MLDKEKRILSFNKAFCDLFSCGREDGGVTGETLRLITANDEDYSRLLQDFDEAVSRKGVHAIEWEFVSKGGSLITAEATISPILNTSGNEGKDETEGFVCILHDISARKEREAALRAAEAQLRHAQKMEAIGVLAGGVAHDFNNILTALIGYCNLLQMKMEKEDPLRQYVSQMLASTDKAIRLTQSLLTFSRKQPIHLKPNKMNEIVIDAEKLLKRLLSEDIELRTVLRPGDITIMADSTQVEQILMNLATNARDAMKERRMLTIKTELADIDGEFIKIHGYGRPGRYALLSVTDTGEGMNEETKEHIFEPFFTTKEAGKGTGLGLSTVYGIVKQHEGYITVESEPGVGTEFRVYFPAVDVEKEEARPSDQDIRGGKETILVAEDDREIRGLIEEILRIYGYGVIAAADGEEAIRKFAEHKETIKLVIVDAIMPKKNGKQVYAEISRLSPTVKTLFVSGYERDDVFEEDIQVEDTRIDFLAKPIMPDDLLEKIRTLLDGHAGSIPSL
ncbi:MAG: Blue-light-activated protein [Syntrophorhabdaceae bacterium PtaU1.Bin034]|nr:MAG: Blue-light-activated protein [Syntrophorhabdaceae bacterium PtaU1.Bin034]